MATAPILNEVDDLHDDLAALILRMREAPARRIAARRTGTLRRDCAAAPQQIRATLRHLATADHRILSDPCASDLRSLLAGIDAALGRNVAETPEERRLASGEIQHALQSMAAIAATPEGGPHRIRFQRLIDERRIELGGALVEPEQRGVAQRIDEGLRKGEDAVDRGVGVGRAVDGGLDKATHLAEWVGKLAGEDAAIGRAAQMAAHAAGAGHEKLEQALGVAEKGASVLHRGRELFEKVAVHDQLDRGRVRVHRGGIRGSAAATEIVELDAGAADTWTGSGEGVKLFSDVFGAFLPADDAVSRRSRPARHRKPRPKAKGKHRPTGFFGKLFDRHEHFSEAVAHRARQGTRLLGRGMHFAETGMHALHLVESAAGRMEGGAEKAARFLERIGLHRVAAFAGSVGRTAASVDRTAETGHRGLKKADGWMGKGKMVAEMVDSGAGRASGVFGELAEGHVDGALLRLFKASRDGDGIDGGTAPESMEMRSALDEPRRLDVATLSRMEGFLGGSFSGVRIHTGEGAAEVTQRFNAEAVTVQDHIFFAPGRFNPATIEGQKLLAHELTHVLQEGRPNLDVRTAEREALRSEHRFGSAPEMTTLDLSQPQPDWKLPDGMGTANGSGVHTAKRNRSRGDEAAARDAPPDGEEFLEQVSGRVYDLLMEELEHSFDAR